MLKMQTIFMKKGIIVPLTPEVRDGLLKYPGKHCGQLQSAEQQRADKLLTSYPVKFSHAVAEI